MPGRAAPLGRAAGVLAAILFTAAAPARAQGLSAAQMSADMHRYFAGEKREGVAFLSIGLPALAAGAALVAQEGAFPRGVAYPLLAVGLIEAGAGLVVYLRTDRQVAGLDRRLALTPAAFQREELLRMRRVNGQFRLLEAVEMTLAFGGAAMAMAGALQGEDSVRGVGLGLCVQSLAMLVLDVLAARRALRYTESLERFSPR